MNNELPYWIAIAHLPRWGFGKINELIIKFYHTNKISIIDFFNLDDKIWRNEYSLGDKEVFDLQTAKTELASHTFIVESMLDQGYEFLPITSPEYSKTLKNNLKVQHSPALLYVKGNKNILQEQSIAIVGSRDAKKISLDFTDNIAKLASEQFKVVVSGFAKGVDKQALDSAINYKGQSIIVLPQGIMTFASGFKKYYKQIIDGDVLVLSTFPPKVTWSAGLAMARNPIIYGLASEIYVAESSDKGGTWSGVIDGLRKNRTIFVRKPDFGEANANELLIEKGAKPVNFFGNVIDTNTESKANEPEISIEDKIINLLKQGEFTLKEMIEKLRINIDEKKLKEKLSQIPNIIKLNKKPLKFKYDEAVIGMF